MRDKKEEWGPFICVVSLFIGTNCHGSTLQVTMGRAPCCEKVGLKRGRWTAEEDQILTNYILDNGEGSWRSLPKNAGTIFF